MDPRRFDAMARMFAMPGSRRRFLAGLAAPALACCTDDDCGGDAVCQRKVCNRGTHTCEWANAESDSRCTPNACGNFGCVDGVCKNTDIISTKPFSACFEYVCDPAIGRVKGAPKPCNNPGPCETAVGATCVEENQRGCVYPSTCASCQKCENGQCVDDCPVGVVGCRKYNGVCVDIGEARCFYQDTCGPCATCDRPGPEFGCLPKPEGHVIILGENQGAICCNGSVNDQCKPGICPFEGVCCDQGQIVVDGRCCPPGTLHVCTGAIGEDPECCDHPCTCRDHGCICA